VGIDLLQRLVERDPAAPEDEQPDDGEGGDEKKRRHRQGGDVEKAEEQQEAALRRGGEQRQILRQVVHFLGHRREQLAVADSFQGAQGRRADLADDAQAKKAQPLLEEAVGFLQRGAVGHVIEGEHQDIEDQVAQTDRFRQRRLLGRLVDQPDKRRVADPGQHRQDNDALVGIAGVRLE